MKKGAVPKVAERIAHKQQGELKQLAGDGVSAMGQPMEEAKAKLKQHLVGAMRRNADGRLEWKAGSYKKVRAAVKGVAHHVETNLHDTLKVTTDQARALAVRHANSSLSRFTGRATKVEESAKVAKAVAPQIKSVSARIGSSRGPRGVEAVTQKMVTSDIVEGGEVAETMRGMLAFTEMDAEILDDVALDAAAAADMVVDTLFDRFLSWVETAVRTENASAYGMQMQESLTSPGLPEMQQPIRRVWMAEGPSVCSYCSDLGGQVVEGDDPYVDEDGEEIDGPPAHPNCMCSEQPVWWEDNEEPESAEEAA